MFVLLVCILLKRNKLVFQIHVTFTSPLRTKKEKRYVGLSQIGRKKKTCFKQHLKATALSLTRWMKDKSRPTEHADVSGFSSERSAVSPFIITKRVFQTCHCCLVLLCQTHPLGSCHNDKFVTLGLNHNSKLQNQYLPSATLECKNYFISSLLLCLFSFLDFSVQNYHFNQSKCVITHRWSLLLQLCFVLIMHDNIHHYLAKKSTKWSVYHH